MVVQRSKPARRSAGSVCVGEKGYPVTSQEPQYRFAPLSVSSCGASFDIYPVKEKAVKLLATPTEPKLE